MMCFQRPFKTKLGISCPSAWHFGPPWNDAWWIDHLIDSGGLRVQNNFLTIPIHMCPNAAPLFLLSVHSPYLEDKAPHNNEPCPAATFCTCLWRLSEGKHNRELVHICTLSAVLCPKTLAAWHTECQALLAYQHSRLSAIHARHVTQGLYLSADWFTLEKYFLQILLHIKLCNLYSPCGIMSSRRVFNIFIKFPFMELIALPLHSIAHFIQLLYCIRGRTELPLVYVSEVEASCKWCKKVQGTEHNASFPWSKPKQCRRDLHEGLNRL